MSTPARKVCIGCARKAPWTCRGCGAECCEHRCGGKTPDGMATCVKCSRAANPFVYRGKTNDEKEGS